MRRLALITSLIVVILSAACFADEAQEKDFLETAIYAGLAAPTGGLTNWSDSLGAKTGFSLGFDVGYFMTPSMVVGVTFTYSQLGVDASDNASQQHHRFYNPAVYGKYYFFSESKFAPYVKAQVGVDNAKFATSVRDQNGDLPKYREMSYDPAFAIGAGVGAFYYTSDVSGFFLEAGVHHGFTTGAKGTYQDKSFKFNASSTLFDIHGGLAVFFGSNK